MEAPPKASTVSIWKMVYLKIKNLFYHTAAEIKKQKKKLLLLASYLACITALLAPDIGLLMQRSPANLTNLPRQQH